MRKLYDAAGRLTAEDYSPCLAHHPDHSAPDFTFGSESGLEVFNRYDTPPETTDVTGITTAEPACTIATGLYLGRLVSVSDCGQRTVTTYDGRGRVTCVARQMAKPGVPADALAARYTPTWYVQTAKFDAADRPIEEGTGVYSLRTKVSQLLGGDGKSNITTSYTKRGSVLAVGSSYGGLVTGVVHDADGLAVSIGYGDVAKTTTEYTYDDKRRLRTVQTFRGPPPLWSGTTISPTPTYGSGTPSTFQLLLEDTDFSYDVVDNPVEIRDWRSPGEWPAGAKPVTKKIGYDDLYRVNQVDYSYSAGDDAWVSPFAHENAAAASGSAVDPRLAKPSPHVSFDKRVLRQTWTYDWLGNTTNTDDDAKGFYDRSLGGIVNGTAGAGPYQLKSAAQSVGPRAGSLTAKYDDAGYLTSLAVHRSGPCLPTAAKCSQRFVYDWDEAGRLQRARRWDLTSAGLASDAVPTGTPDAELRYQYDGGDQRTLKTAVDAAGAERHTVYVLGSLELRRAEYVSGDYAIGPYTVVPYLFAHGVRLARLAWEDSDVPSIPTLSNPRLHVFFELGDHLGSTSTVLDKDTSELVEKSTYLPYGGAESDYRPGRWKGFREDHRFTGKEGDEEVGLSYFGFRYLAPQLARWASADPLTIHTAAADANVYAYVHGRALRAVDARGTSSSDEPPITLKDTKIDSSGAWSNEQSYDSSGNLLGDKTTRLLSPSEVAELHASVTAKLDQTSPPPPAQDLTCKGMCKKADLVRSARINGLQDFVLAPLDFLAPGFNLENPWNQFRKAIRAPEPTDSWAKSYYGGAKSDVSTFLTVTSLGVGGVSAALRPTTLGKAATAAGAEGAGAAAKGGEVFYRTMSQAHADQLLATGRLAATSETFVSPSRSFVEGYLGVVVEFRLQAGTTEQLARIGVRNGARAAAKAYPSMPKVSKGWTSGNAFFKGEGKAVNIGLGHGAALDVFNSNITEFNVVRF